LLEESPIVTSPDRRRQFRAIELLERVATPGAASILSDLSKGDPTAPETQAAIDAVRRLTERPNH